jgi:hypothetical protein
VLVGRYRLGATLGEGESLDSTPDPLAGGIDDADTGVFRNIPGALIEPRTQHTATLLPSGEVLVIGGTAGAGFAPVELLDPRDALGHPPRGVTRHAPRRAHGDAAAGRDRARRRRTR